MASKLINKWVHKGEIYTDDYVSVRDIVKRFPDVPYYMFIGARSNGKSYGALDYALERYFNEGEEFAYIRRYDSDFDRGLGDQVFTNLVHNKLISKLSGGKWDGVKYRSGKWWLTLNNPDGSYIQDVKPFAYAFALNKTERYKSTSYPDVSNIIFDEFLTREYELPNEFVKLMNLISTIVRDPSRTDVKIFMLANTVNFDSQYWREFGILSAKNMNIGDMLLYDYGDSAMKLLVSYTLPLKVDLKVNRLFAFDNPQIAMINDGVWETSRYPRIKFKGHNIDKDVVFSFFIIHRGETVKGDIYTNDEGAFIKLSPKFTPIKDPYNDLIYTDEVEIPVDEEHSISRMQYNVRTDITRPTDSIDRSIWKLFCEKKVYYSDNMTGEVVNNYIKSCQV